jgi:hypothetical protein
MNCRMMFYVIQILTTLVMNNHEDFVQNQFLTDEWFCWIQTFHLVNLKFSSQFKSFLSLFQALLVVILRSFFFSVLIFIRHAYVKSCVMISTHRLLLLWSFVLFISRNHLETWFTSSCLEDLMIFISWSTE